MDISTTIWSYNPRIDPTLLLFIANSLDYTDNNCLGKLEEDL